MEPPHSPLATPGPWDLVADGYAREIVPQFEAYARDALRLAGVAPGSRVLDVACGPGTLALVAAREAAHVTALDFAPAMVASLRARLAQAGVTNVDAREGDGQALALGDATFDAAFSMFGLMFFPDRLRGLRELRRVLVPGGRVAISSWQPLSGVPMLAAVFDTLREQLPDTPLGSPQPPLGTADEVRTELTAAGFHDVAAHGVEHSTEYADAAAFGASLRRTFAPLVLVQRRLGEAAFGPIGAAIDARLAALAGPGPVRVTMPAWIGVATA